MKKIYKNLLCLVSGLLTALSMTGPKLSALIFVSLIPFMYVICEPDSNDRHRVFRSVFIFCFIYTSAACSWIIGINSSMYNSGRLTLILIIILMLIIAAVHAVIMCLCTFVFSSHQKDRIRDILIFAALFVLGEWFHETLYPVTFPWFRLAAAATPFPVLIQSAGLFGSLFISYLIICINGLAAFALRSFKNKRKLIVSLSVLVCIVAGDYAYGAAYMFMSDKDTQPVSAVLFQTNVGEKDKHIKSCEETLKCCTDCLGALDTDEVNLAVLPESAVTFDIINDSASLSKIKKIADQKDVTVIIGLYTYKDDQKYNSMAAVFPDGSMSDIYCKNVLVPFGEMIPFDWLIGRPLRKMFDSIGDFAAGNGPSVIETGNGKAGCIICYESLYPSASRKAVREGADFLLLLSNDSWFCGSSELYQHHAHAVLRAVEFHRPVARCSATGITSFISSTGYIQCSAPTDQKYSLKGTIQSNDVRTLYSYLGDIIVIPGALLLASGLIKKYIKTRSR